jgi:hypothetical protein
MVTSRQQYIHILIRQIYSFAPAAFCEIFETLVAKSEDACIAMLLQDNLFLGIVPLSTTAKITAEAGRDSSAVTVSPQKRKVARKPTHSIVDSGKALFKAFLIASRLK